MGEVDAPYAEFYVQPGIHTISINLAGAAKGKIPAEQFVIDADETLGLEYSVQLGSKMKYSIKVINY